MEVDRSELMLGYVEPYYRESRLYKAQNNAKGQEFNIIHTIIEELPNQFNPQTATWGLRLWEELLDIDSGDSHIEERRGQVLFKLAASQMITPLTLERLLKKLTKTNVTVINNIAPYTFAVKVTMNDNVPINFDYIKDVIEDLKPAHLCVELIAYYFSQLKISIHYENAIFFRTRFYPRYNQAFLNLDNTWGLDGRLLNGYDGDSRLDFYPVLLRMQVPVKEQVETGQWVRLFSGAREVIGLNTGYKIQTEARASPETAERFCIKTAVKEQSGAGPVRVMNLNVLDNEWTLNDSRKLNGGLTIL